MVIEKIPLKPEMFQGEQVGNEATINGIKTTPNEKIIAGKINEMIDLRRRKPRAIPRRCPAEAA